MSLFLITLKERKTVCQCDFISSSSSSSKHWLLSRWCCSLGNFFSARVSLNPMVSTKKMYSKFVSWICWKYPARGKFPSFCNSWAKQIHCWCSCQLFPWAAAWDLQVSICGTVQPAPLTWSWTTLGGPIPSLCVDPPEIQALFYAICFSAA